MKKTFSILLSISLLLSLCSCKEIEKAETTVNNFFTAMSNKDQNALQQYIVSVDNSQDAVGVKSFNEYNEDFLSAFSKTTYSIKSSEVDAEDKNKVNVELDVTAIDLATLYQDAIQATLEIALSNILSSKGDTDISDEAYEHFVSNLRSDNVKTKTTSATFTVTKTDDGWKIVGDDEFYDSVTGGFVSYVNSLGDTLNAN